MTTEYGIFNDEGMIEGSFFKLAEALEAIVNDYPKEDCWAALICPDHEGQDARLCEICNAEDD